MAGPLYGIGAQQQIPLATATQQPQAAQQQRENEEKQAVTNEIQPREAESAESQNTETTNDNVFNLSQEELYAAADQGRGALLDVVV